MPEDTASVGSDDLIAAIYDLALAPENLNAFIERWRVPLDHDETAGQGERIEAHLERAQLFLQATEAARVAPEDHLQPFDGLAGLVLNQAGQIVAANAGAEAGLSARTGQSLSELSLSDEARDTIASFARGPQAARAEQIFRYDPEARGSPKIVRLSALPGEAAAQGLTRVLFTDLVWSDEVDLALGQAFDLTPAEQKVVAAIVAGKSTPEIAAMRGVQESTVRGQIKTILGKVGLGSKTDLVRLVLPLVIVPGAPPAPAVQTGGWLATEVWKPFEEFTHQGRRLTYHTIGPKTGRPVLLSHMGSTMLRWPEVMVRAAFGHNLRLICPIRAGYGGSAPHRPGTEVFTAIRADTLALLDHLGVETLPYASQGTDLPLAIDMAAAHPDRIAQVIGIGGRPCLPGGAAVEGKGEWQRFFVGAARRTPGLAGFAASAVMAMSRRMGSKAMLRQLCKDSPADLALIANPRMAEVLEANLDIMADKNANTVPAFAREFIAFYADWSDRVMHARNTPIRVFVANEDPTFDLGKLPALQAAYPWITFEVIENAGLALLFQQYQTILPVLADAARGRQLL